ncbi:hypothetical protein LINPERHAP1_LOCUS28536, partial [Linum perenne]
MYEYKFITSPLIWEDSCSSSDHISGSVKLHASKSGRVNNMEAA